MDGHSLSSKSCEACPSPPPQAYQLNIPAPQTSLSTRSRSPVLAQTRRLSQAYLDSSSTNAISGPPSRGITQLTLKELCDEIRTSPNLATYPVDDLYRREIPTGVQHEFIIVRSAPRDGRPAIWIRIDRAAMGYRERFNFNSRYEADDTVSLFIIFEKINLILIILSGSNLDNGEPPSNDWRISSESACDVRNYKWTKAPDTR